MIIPARFTSIEFVDGDNAYGRIDRCQWIWHDWVPCPPHVDRCSAPSPRRCCSPVTGAVSTRQAAETLARMFKALGDPTRVRLLSLIAAADGGRGLHLRPHRPGRPVPAHRLPPHEAAGRGRPRSPASSAASGPTTASSTRPSPRSAARWPRRPRESTLETPAWRSDWVEASTMSPILSEAASIASRHRLPGHTLRGEPCEPTRPRQTARPQLDQPLSRAARLTEPQSSQPAAVPLQPRWTAAHPARNRAAAVQARNPGRAAAGPDRM